MTFSHGFSELSIGESIAINGACLTVVAFESATFDVELSKETLKLTNLGELRVSDEVNMERALRASDRLGGHMVTGHVDGLGAVIKLEPEGEMTRVSLELPTELSKYVARKGSITVDGVSLTVNAVAGNCASLLIIPHTLDVTTLGSFSVGRRVNVEVDLVARYVERLLRAEVTDR